MPLDLKELESGHFVLFIVQLKIWTSGRVETWRHFTRDEPTAQRMRSYLWEHFQEHDCCAAPVAAVEAIKEIVVFDGATLHTLTGRKFPLQAIQTSFEAIDRFKDDPHEDWILAVFKQSRKQRRPRWQRILIDLGCLCCACCCIDKSVTIPW